MALPAGDTLTDSGVASFATSVGAAVIRAEKVAAASKMVLEKNMFIYVYIWIQCCQVQRDGMVERPRDKGRRASSMLSEEETFFVVYIEDKSNITKSIGGILQG